MAKAKANKLKQTEVLRKIHFFGCRFVHGIGDSETEVGAEQVMDSIAALPMTDDGRYLVRDEKDIALFSCEKKGGNLHGRIAYARRGARPSVEKKGTGEIHPIAQLGPDDGIVEITHFILYPADKVLAIEYNHHGPRAATLATYIENKASGLLHHVDLPYVTNRDFQTRIRQMDPNGIRAFHLRMPVDRIYQIKEVDGDIFEAIASAKKFGESEEVELIWRPKKRSRKNMPIIDRLKNIGKAMGSAEKEREDLFTHLRVTARDVDTGRMKEFDLLEEQLVSTVHVAKETNDREVETSAMFKKIDEAYRSKRDEIVSTLAI